MIKLKSTSVYKFFTTTAWPVACFQVTTSLGNVLNE